jgi:hypothetical protein
MKKIAFLTVIALLVISCKKESTNPLLATSQTVDDATAIISTEDSVDFYWYGPGTLIDKHNNHLVSLICNFHVYAKNADSIYPKEFVFSVAYDPTVVVTEALLTMDGVRFKELNFTQDHPFTGTLDFFATVPALKAVPTINPNNLVGDHSLSLRIRGLQSNTGAYQPTLEKALFLNKEVFPQTQFLVNGLPLLGRKCVYQ